VVEERLTTFIHEIWIAPLKQYRDPIDGLIEVIRQARESMGDDILLRLGCPLNNLAQEMSSIDEGFRQRIHDVYMLWHRSIVEALSRGQGAGLVREDIDCDNVAMFIVATIEGAVGMAKNARREDIVVGTMRAVFDYLESLRA
ncbi:MAG: TetR family transcriptional regulator C-terminal domain-containing protein, partial [Granulosicoccaceae bacterium]